MLLTDKLLGFLNRVFSKDPDQFLAFRIDYDGGMSWKVLEGRLYTNVSGGSGTDLNIDLSAHTLSTLSAYIATQAGYSVSSNVTDSRAIRTAQILIDGTNSPAASNGDCLYAYSSLTWSYMHANAMQLVKAKTDIVEMLKQMSLQSAESEWLDDLGDYYGIRRLAGEPDTIYVDRILLTIIRPKGNNIALAMAIETLTKKTGAIVVDAPMTTVTQHEYRHGAARYDGATTRAVQETSFYGQFDVTANFDLLAAENIADLLVRIRAAVEQFRDAGTKLRQVALSGSISDTARAGSDTSDIALTQALMSDEYIGVRSRHDGTVLRGGLTVNQRRMRNRPGFYFDGSVRRDEADGVSNSATAFYGEDVDPSTLHAQAALADTWSVEFGYGGIAPRNGTLTRSGARSIGLDSLNLLLTRHAYHNGKFQRSGFPFSGHTTETM